MNGSVRRSVGALTLLLMNVAIAGAQEPVGLASASRLVVVGRVSGVETRWDAAVQAIYTYVTVAVTDRLKGADTPAVLVLKQLGGQVGAVGLQIEGQAAFAPGENVLLFLTVRPRDATLYTVGLGAGKWLVSGDPGTGRQFAVPPSGNAVVDLGELGARLAAVPVDQRPFLGVPSESRHPTPAYRFLPTGGPPARWHKADEDVRVDVGAQADPGGLGVDAQGALQSAINRWNGARTKLQLQYIGSQPVSPPCNYGYVGDDRIRVYFNDPCGELADDGTFGIGGGFYTTGDQRTINGTTFQEFVQGLAVLNNAGPHLSSAGCYQDALTHKLGHALGLGHSDATGAIMQPSLPSSCASGASVLGQDDIEGLRAIYPALASGPNPPQAPTIFTGSVLLNRVTLQWTPATAGGPAQSYIVEAGSAPGLSNLATLIVSGTSTSTVVGSVPAGTYYVRVRARNIIATSGPSPEALISVAPCAAPNAPAAFTASVADRAVVLNWTPPAAGTPVQGYRLAVGSAPGLANLLVQDFAGATTSVGTTAPYGDYYARLAATNSCGVGPSTPDILVRVQPCTASPGAPTRLAFTRTGNVVTLGWTAPAGPPPLRYLLAVGSAPGGSNLLVQPTAGSTPSFIGSGPRGTYFVRVLAQNACGNSPASNEVQVVIP